MRANFRNLAPEIGLQVRKSMEMARSVSHRTGFLLEPGEQILVLEGQHPAVSVLDDEPFVSAKQVVRNQQRADHVIGHDAASVADNVGVASLETGEVFDRKPRVHAGNDRQMTGRRNTQAAELEVADIFFVCAKYFV